MLTEELVDSVLWSKDLNQCRLLWILVVKFVLQAYEAKVVCDESEDDPSSDGGYWVQARAFAEESEYEPDRGDGAEDEA